MPIDFPSGPTTGQSYTYQGRSWVYNGSAWDTPRALSEIGAVMVFADAAARSAAITAPTEGMVSYLNDSDRLEVYGGVSWGPFSVASGGTGATSLSSGGYLKGAGTSAITSQAGIPAGDITSGTLPVGRGGTGATTLSSGGYLKGAGASAITSQSGIPAGDVTSGTLASARMPAGSVLQVVNVDNVTRTAQGFSASSILDISGMQATITPQRANSKIVIFARWFGEFSNFNNPFNSVFGISRNGSQIGRQPDPGATVISGITMAAISYDLSDTNSTPETVNLFIADLPNTTSAVTYRMTLLGDTAATLFTNRTVGWTGQTNGFELGTSSMMLMEVAV
jgi:hypothetical protein